MREYVDVFNGDADGICALQQMRLVEPVDSELVTGVKRDISLVSRVTDAKNVLVLDISLDKNRQDIKRLLTEGSTIRYFDHHYAGDIPEHENFASFINTEKNICTSLLVNQYLENEHYLWASVGAFGDNMHDSAIRVIENAGLKQEQVEQLNQLGVYINYNGYGGSLDDLYFKPDALFQTLQPYRNPLDFISAESTFEILKTGYLDDMSKGMETGYYVQQEGHAVILLPDEKWARRVSGVLGNALANEYPERAHAILSEKQQGGYQVSVRAPKVNRTGADELCRQFETGGGRQAAAGINHLPGTELDYFVSRFMEAF